MMKVFIECEAGSTIKNRFDDVALTLNESFEVPRPYPYAYGFVIGTAAADGGSIDCFVLDTPDAKAGSFLDCEPIGLLEMIESDEIDHKILAVRSGQNARSATTAAAANGSAIDDSTAAAETIKVFILELFKKFPEAKLRFGELGDSAAAKTFIEKNRLQ